jgi:hypothetical protein
MTHIDFNRLSHQTINGVSIMTTLKMKLLVAAVASLAASASHAAIVTQWTVDVDATFLPGSIVDSNGGTPGGVVISNANKRLRWGTDIGNGQSGLDIGNSPASTTVPTGVGVVLPATPNITVTHLNQPITAPSLDKVSLKSVLTLTPLVPALPGLPSDSLTFLIDFLETPNDGTNGVCADGGTPGVGPLNGNGCSDIFVIDKESLNFPFFYDTDGEGGDDPQQYFISFLELTSGLNPLPPAACLAATGSNAPCLGFRTPEAANTTVQFGAVITTEKVVVGVPEPGILGLLGLGLAGMGFALRRKA